MSKLIWHGPKVLQKAAKTHVGIVSCIAKRIATLAQQIVVVKSGRLKRSIHATKSSIVVSEPYARAIELGTATRAAQPYLRPAIERFNKADLKQCIE